MENASKALIIAGAILISILLISVGIIIMNAINDPVQQGAGAAESQAIEMFNSKFISYEGKQKGSSLKTLASSINASNGSDPNHTITLSKNSSISITKMSEINPNTTYTIEAVYAETDAPTLTGTRITGATTPKSEVGYIYELVITAEN